MKHRHEGGGDQLGESSFFDHLVARPLVSETQGHANIGDNILEMQTTDDRLLPFAFRLHRMLDYAEKQGKQDVISWLPFGKSFRVHNQDEFIRDVSPVYFNLTQYKSFQRQLLNYGFMRIEGGGTGTTHRNISQLTGCRDLMSFLTNFFFSTLHVSTRFNIFLTAGGGFYHPFFIRDDPTLCRFITRDKVKNQNMQENFSTRHYLQGGVLGFENNTSLETPRLSDVMGSTTISQASDTQSSASSGAAGNHPAHFFSRLDLSSKPAARIMPPSISCQAITPAPSSHEPGGARTQYAPQPGGAIDPYTLLPTPLKGPNKELSSDCMTKKPRKEGPSDLGTRTTEDPSEDIITVLQGSGVGAATIAWLLGGAIALSDLSRVLQSYDRKQNLGESGAEQGTIQQLTPVRTSSSRVIPRAECLQFQDEIISLFGGDSSGSNEGAISPSVFDF